MLKISVTSTEVRNQSGVAKGSGKPYSLSFQTAWIHTYDRTDAPNPYPEKIEIILEKDKDGAALFYPVGDYTLAPSSVYLSRTGDLSITPRLRPIPKNRAVPA